MTLQDHYFTRLVKKLLNQNLSIEQISEKLNIREEYLKDHILDKIKLI